jgi:putative transposon-encoded protein
MPASSRGETKSLEPLDPEVKTVRSSDHLSVTLNYIQNIYVYTGNRSEIDAEGVLDDELTEFGNSAHATVPKRWRGADLRVVHTAEPAESAQE